MADIFPVAIMLFLAIYITLYFLKAWGKENKQNLFQKMQSFYRALLFIFRYLDF